MAGKNDEFIYNLRMANPIDDVMRSYVHLKRRGRTSVCNCPFHSEKTPSCTVFPDTQSFYCFGCGAGGDVITFIMKIENLDFMEAVKLLAQRVGMEVPEKSGSGQLSQLKTKIYEMNRLSANFFYTNLIKGKNRAGLNYIIKRGILPDTIKKYGLGFAPDSWDSLVNYLKSKGYTDDEIASAWLGGRSGSTGKVYDMFRNRVMFPIVDLRGNVIGFGGRVLDDSKPKYLNTAKTPVFDKGSNLFSLHFAKKSGSKKIILCEGYMDVISLNQAGFENAVATLGTAITPEQARILSNYADEVAISYDSDSAGQQASQKAINHLGQAGVKTTVVNMRGAKDPDEYIKNYGADSFRIIVEGSADAVNFLLDRCEQDTDIESEAGKVEFLKKASKVLADIDSPLEREVYISRTAKKCDIPVDVLKAHIDGILKKSRYSRKTNDWKSTKSTSLPVADPVNPDAVSHQCEAKAEEMLICCAMRRLEDAEKIYAQVSPELFVTSFNKKVYTAIKSKISTGSKFSISLLADEFSVDEMGRISGIDAKNREVGFNDKAISDCINTLKRYWESVKENETEQTDEEKNDSLQKLFGSKKG